MHFSCLANDWLRVQALSHWLLPSWAGVFHWQSTSTDLLLIHSSVVLWGLRGARTGSLPLLTRGLVPAIPSQRTGLLGAALLSLHCLCSPVGRTAPVCCRFLLASLELLALPAQPLGW